MPSSQFEAAAKFLSNATSLSKVSNMIKLELYGLFKTVTVGNVPTTTRPSIFDMTGRAKWDAWNTAGENFPSPSAAEARYLEIAKELGWDETEEIPQNERDADGVKGNMSDSEEGEGQAFSSGSGGLGLSVSTMARPQEVNENTLHGFAVYNDVEGIKYLLAIDPDMDLNEVDEHGYTPLHLAADRGHLEIVKLLLEKSVDRTIKDPDDMTALELARIAGHSEIVSVLSK